MLLIFRRREFGVELKERIDINPIGDDDLIWLIWLRHRALQAPVPLR